VTNDAVAIDSEEYVQQAGGASTARPQSNVRFRG